MPKFIRAGSQYINLDYVRIVKRTGKNEYAAIMDDGEIIDGIQDFEAMPMNELPAQGNWECLGPDLSKKGQYHAYPVISWGITPNGDRVPTLPDNMKVSEELWDYVVRRAGDECVHHNFHGRLSSVFEWLDTLPDFEKQKAA